LQFTAGVAGEGAVNDHERSFVDNLAAFEVGGTMRRLQPDEPVGSPNVLTVIVAVPASVLSVSAKATTIIIASATRILSSASISTTARCCTAAMDSSPAGEVARSLAAIRSPLHLQSTAALTVPSHKKRRRIDNKSELRVQPNRRAK
jgi:hypothetical protein